MRGKETTHALLSGPPDVGCGILQLYDKSGKKLIHAGGTDESAGLLITFNKDGTITNSVGWKSTSTSTYQKKVIRTRSLDRDRYKPAPGNHYR